MGIFDKWLGKNKKHENLVRNTQTTTFEREPLTLRHSDGRIENIYFNGIVNVHNKALMAVGIDQGVISNDGTRMFKNYYIEPHYDRDASGNIIENTEEYYREHGVHPEHGGDPRKYNAIKGFFQAREITKEKIGSNYIGGLGINTNGEYYRQYDENFKQKYVQMVKNQDLAEQQRKEQIRIIAEQEKQEMINKGIESQLKEMTQDPADYDSSNPRTGEAGVLTPEQREKIDRYSKMI